MCKIVSRTNGVRQMLANFVLKEEVKLPMILNKKRTELNNGS